MSWYRHAIPSEGSAIDFSSQPQTSPLLLKAITVSWSTAPTTAGELTITLDSALGASYDVELYVVDPSTDSLTAVLLTDINLPIFVGDSLTVAYANADSRAMGVQIILSDGAA